MSFSFKKFVQLVDQDEVSDEQINELFGLSDKEKQEKQADLAAKRSAEFKARRDALRKKATGQQGADDEDDEDDQDPRAAKKAQPAQAARSAQANNRPGNGQQRSTDRYGQTASQVRSANSAARSGQVDWAMESKKPRK